MFCFYGMVYSCLRKIPKYVLQYFNETWTKENRKTILKSFKISVNKKYVRYKNNFLEEKVFEKKIKVYDKNNTLFKEFNQIKMNESNWYERLSTVGKLYINEFSKKKWKEDNARLPSSYTAGQYSFIEKQLERLGAYFLSNENYHCYLRNDLELRESAINRFIFNREPVFSPLLLIDKIKLYAIKNELPYFNFKGNLLPGVLQDYLKKKKKIPMSTYEKVKLSVKRTEEEFQNLAKTNLEEFKYFVTLTFADIKEKEKHKEMNLKSVEYGEYDLNFVYVKDSTDYVMCIKKLNTFISHLKEKLIKNDLSLKYLGVPEYQKNGSIHYHFLMSDIPYELLYDVPSWLDYDYKIKARRYDKGIKKWIYGKSSVEEIKDKMRIVEYISKYLMKSLEEIKETAFLERLNKRRYYYSRNLEKPVNEYFTDLEDLIEDEEFEIEEPQVLYQKTSLNFYNQNCSTMYVLKEY